MNSEIIRAQDVSKIFKRGGEKVSALKNISLSINEGEFIAIVGPSGSGKSTLLHMLGLLDVPSGGSVSLNGNIVSKLNENGLVKLRRANIGFVFQQFYLLPTLNVRENIQLPLLFHKKHNMHDRVGEIIDLLGLKHRADHLPQQLSGGEMQRVSIGRALINEPKIIMADEPTGNLDSVTAEKIFQVFIELNKTGLSLIIVTHNMDLAGMAHRIIRLKDGEIIDIHGNN